MSKINPNAPKLIDEYISKKEAPFQEILTQLRSIILSADDRIAEDWKWGAPNFNYKGLISWLVAFKKDVGMNFYKGALMKDKYNLFVEDKADEKGNRIIKFNTLADIKEDQITDYIQQAVLLNEKGVKVEKKEVVVEIPDYFQDVLTQHPKAKETFERFGPSYQRDYIEWITEAKREATRETRITKTLGLLEEGKHLHWKYEK